jgi:enoyl-CoA hydratase
MTDLGTRHLHWEVRASTAWVTIDRPEKRNALTSSMYFGIRRAVDRVNATPALRALAITGVGDVFAPGGDLAGGGDEDLGTAGLVGTGLLPFDAIRESRKPVVAMVNGLCMGGGLLIAMLSDVAIASDRAVFAAPELRRGVADAFYAAILPEQVGIAVARDMLFTGRRLDAEEALRHGLVARVVPHDELQSTTERVLRDLMLSAPRAQTALKRLVNARYGVVDRMTFEESLTGEEVVEGFAAFLAKRAPSWVPPELHDTGRA